MKLIAHRGNILGKIQQEENNPKYISAALLKGYEAEIDLWIYNGELWLGHDRCDYKINLSFLIENKNKFWIHAKHLDAIEYLQKTDLNWFWHENDKITFTSKGYIWTYPEIIIENTVVNQPSYNSSFWQKCQTMNFIGLCMDDFSQWHKLHNLGRDNG